MSSRKPSSAAVFSSASRSSETTTGNFSLPVLWPLHATAAASPVKAIAVFERELPLLDVDLPVDHLLGPRRVWEPSLHGAGHPSCLARPLAACALDPGDPRDAPSCGGVARLGGGPLARHRVAAVWLQAVRVEYPPGPLDQVRPERRGERRRGGLPLRPGLPLMSRTFAELAKALLPRS